MKITNKLRYILILIFAIHANFVCVGSDGNENGDNKASSPIFPVDIKKVDIKWLSGDQPKILTAMASAEAVTETLNGSSVNVGAILGGWHAQAVGQYKNYIYVAFSSGKISSDKAEITKQAPGGNVAKLWIYNLTDKQSKMVKLEKGYPHPCSIQVTGDYLTIVVEAEYGVSQAALGSTRDQRSLVQIFDLSKDPNCSVEVGRLKQDGMNSGGAGLTYHPGMKCWYMLVDQDKNGGGVAVYKSKTEALNSWQPDPIAYYQRFGSGAGLNLITASDNSIWGFWYDSTHENLPTFSKIQMAGDQVKLFKLINPGGKPVESRTVFTQVVNLESPKVEQVGELLANRPGMRFGAGFRFENGKMEVLTCQRNMAREFNVNRMTIADVKQTQVMFVNMAVAKGEIYCNSKTNASQKYHEERKQSESWNGVLASPIEANINYFGAGSVSSGGFGSFTKSIPKWSDAIEKTTSAPLVLFYLEGTKDVVGKTIEFMPSKAVDKKR